MISLSVLQHLTRRIRTHIVEPTTLAGSGHPSSCLSAVELMSVLFFGGFFHQDITNFSYPFNDKFILSKGHAAPLLYALYEAAGVLSEKELMTLRTFDSRLQGHPTPLLPFVDVATGSLGQGLSVGLGMALGIKLKIKEMGLTIEREPRVFVLMGDSEMAEGQVWEAMECASYYKVNNLVGIVDINRLGQNGETHLGWNLKTYTKRVEAFGWRVIEIDNGHNLKEVHRALKKATEPTSAHMHKPIMLLAHTVKGRGVPFMEDKEGWHGKAIPKDQLQEALKTIGPYDAKIIGVITKPPSVDFKEQKEIKKLLYKLSAVIDSAPALIPASAPRQQARCARVGNPFARATYASTDKTYDAHDTIATRSAFGDALCDLGEENPLVVALDAEVGNSTYTERLKETHPSHFFELYIAEQNMVSVALGLSKIGYIPYLSTFAAFLTRAFDQIRIAQYSNATLNVVGSHAGSSIGQDGVSQMGLEDIAIMRSIRESTVLYPSDAVSAYKLTKAIASRPGINYLRTTRGKTPVIYDPDEEFPIGGCKLHYCYSGVSFSHFERREKSRPKGRNTRFARSLDSSHSLEMTFDAVIIAAGITLHEALKAQKLLEKKGKHTVVVDLYSIKPLDSSLLNRLIKGTKRVVVVEDHYEAGGIGEAILSALPAVHDTHYTFTHLCIRREPRSGTPEEIMRYEEIDAEGITQVFKK